jgi:signal transduction histidine kinase
MLLGVTVLSFLCGLWQAMNHRRTLVSFETSLRDTPRREELTQALMPLIRLLHDDPNEGMSYDERAAAASAHRRSFDATLESVISSVKTQRQRWQEVVTAGKRRNPLDARALFMTLNERLETLRQSRPLEDIGPRPAPDQSLASSRPAVTRRALTIAAFRDDVFGLLDLIEKSPDPAIQLAERSQEAAVRVQRSFQVACLMGLACLLLSLVAFYTFDRALWHPLAALRKSLAAVANREYAGLLSSEGPLEIRAMFASLAAICDRCACGERDKDLEVSDRSKQWVRSERLAGIGLLATGVAHEINNPLGAIVGAADGLKYRLDDVAAHLSPSDAEIVREYVGMIQSEASRCRGITTKLLDFARGRDGERALYDITAIVQEVVGMFRHVRQYQSRTIDLNRVDPCRAFCNGPEIKQVILNLVANALQATPDAGRLDIRISTSPDAVEVVFQDTGSGMSPETLEHLFDPFFSTKGPGQGTGLGLSISHAIVEKHHGILEADSAGPGQGSTFRLRLPSNENAAQAAAERKAA